MRAIALAVVLLLVPAEAAHAAPRLVRFASCGALVRYARAHAPRYTPTPLPGGRLVPGAAQPEAGGGQGGSDGGGSGTNVQEVGIDEPDFVKADGARIFVLAGGRLQAVAAAPGGPRLLGSLPVAGTEVLVRGNRALVIAPSYGGPIEVGGRVSILPIGGSVTTTLTEVDVSDPAAMRVVHTLTMDGSYVSARQDGAVARIVITASPRALAGPQALRARATGWLPSGVLRRGRHGHGRHRALAACRAVRRPRTFSGLGTLTVLTVDLDRGLPAVDADTLLADADTVYAAPGSFYVATRRWGADASSATAIHRFDARGDQTAYRASGEVPGTIASQWSLSELSGVLRVATTGDDTESAVTTLDAATLTPIGRLGGLGKGEQIYGVRFVGELGYVVTFRRVDPLHVIDLHEPARPALLGQLELPGYSAYLHPVGPGLLLGVGQDVSAAGRPQGSQLSLFDVSDPRAPVRLARVTMGEETWSEVEHDHHAFLFWPPASLAVLPVGDDAVAFRVDRASGIAEVRHISHLRAAVRRALVIGDRLYTVSETGVLASNLQSLEPVGWAELATSGTPTLQPIAAKPDRSVATPAAGAYRDHG